MSDNAEETFYSYAGDAEQPYEEQPQQGTWIQCYDEESGYPYLYNDITGETKWVDPSESQNILVTLWQKFYDDNGDEFYYNPHTGESNWELPANAVLEEPTGGAHATAITNEDAQFGDQDEDNIEYDGHKYIEAYSPAKQSLTDAGAENVFDVSLEHEGSLERAVNLNQLGQTSVHSARSTKSANFIPMRMLVKKNSGDGAMEKKTSFGNLNMLEKKHSAQSLGIKSGTSFLLNRTPVVMDTLKPSVPQPWTKGKLTGFALLKVGASILRRQIDESGTTWLEYQAADNGPVFYAQVDGLSAGQWSRPAIFDLEEFSSTSIISVEPVDFNSLDDALLSRPSSKRDLVSATSAASSFNSKGMEAIAPAPAPAAPAPAQEPAVTPSSAAPVAMGVKTVAGAKAQTAKPKVVPAAVEPPATEERKSLFGSFINSVFVETVAKEDKQQQEPQESDKDALALDALFGGEDDEDTSAKVVSAKTPSNRDTADAALYSPDYNPIIPKGAGASAGAGAGAGAGAFSPGLVITTTAGDIPLEGIDPAESPAERIALTPHRKFAPGSGMRKSSFSQLNYIPETQPLFEDNADEVNRDSPVEGDATPVQAVKSGAEASPASATSSTPTHSVGEGMAAVRAMYATSATQEVSVTAVPFQEGLGSAQSATELPMADLFGHLDVAEGAATDVTADVWVQCYDEESGWPYVYNEATGEVKWVEPESTEQLLAVLWEVCYDENGNEFYYNATTGESSWELPDNAKLSSSDQEGSAAVSAGEATADATAEAQSSDAAAIVLSPPASTSGKAGAAEDTPLSPSLVSMKGLTKKASLQSMIEKKTSVGNLTPLAKKQSAASLGIKTGTAWIKSKPPEIKDALKPTIGTPKVGASSLSGFALLKVGAKVLDKQIDEDGVTWVMYQAVDKGPIFYAKEGVESSGQWSKPPIYQDGNGDEEDEPPHEAAGEEAPAAETANEAGPGKGPAAEVAPVQAESVPAPAVAEISLTPMAPTGAVSAPEAPPAVTQSPAETLAIHISSAAVASGVGKVADAPPSREALNIQATATETVMKPLTIPVLALEPIIAQQSPVPAAVNAVPTAESLDPGLFELSGVTIDSKQNKESVISAGHSGVEEEPSVSRDSLLRELREMGLDENANPIVITPPALSQAQSPPMGVSSQRPRSPQARTPDAAETKRIAERKKSNLDAKLLAMDSPVAARLVESPYKVPYFGKSVEEVFPLKVFAAPMPIPTASQKVAAEDKAGAAHSRQRPHSSPTKRRESDPIGAHPTESASSPTKHHTSAARQQQARHTSPYHSRSDIPKDSSYGSAHADVSYLPHSHSPHRASHASVSMMPSSPLPEFPSPTVGGAVKSSFLTELGFTSADPFVAIASDAYRPPPGVHPDTLRAELTRGDNLDATLRNLAGNDVNEDEASILLKRLLSISESGASTAATPGASRPRAQTQDSEGVRDVHTKARRIIERTCLLLERIESSATEHKVSAKQLLGVMVEQRNALVPPRSLVRDLKAHNSLPVHCCSPHSARFPQVEHKLETVADAGAWLLCRDPFFLSGRYFYVHKATQAIQIGEPFDFLMKKARKNISKENWNNYEVNLAVNQHTLENANAELLRDAHGGLLLYSALDDQYSSTGKFDTNWAARARLSGTGMDSFQMMATGTLNMRTSALLNQAGAPRFSHQRPSSANATARGTTSGVAAGAPEAIRAARKNAPKNVWSTFELPSDVDREGLNPQRRSFSMQNTADFGQLDQTAASYDTGSGGFGGDNFATLRDAFAAPSAEDAMADRNHSFTSPYFDTEMLLEMTQKQKQLEPGRMLSFEAAMDPEEYQQYRAKIVEVATEPNNPIPLLELMELLVCQGLGKQAMAAFKRAASVIDSVTDWCFSAHEMATCRILSTKLASKYFMRYEKPAFYHALVDSFPESPFVVTHAADCFHHMKYLDQAELLFVAALMLEPGYDRALLGYARLLVERGDQRTALRYLGRISEDSALWLAAKLEAAGVQELQSVEPTALIAAYKTCTYLQANQSDSAYSTALRCAGYHHHTLHEADKADFFLSRALARNPDNAMALLMSSAIASARLNHRNVASSAAGGQPSERPRTAGAPAIDGSPAEGKQLPRTKEEIDAKFRSGVMLTPKYQYRWIAYLGYADFVNCVMRDTHRAEQYYADASKLAFSYSIWSTLALAHFYQYTRGEAGVAGRLLLRTLRHRHADVAIDCLTDFNAFRHREVDTDPAKEVLKFMSLPAQGDLEAPLVETTDDLEIAALYVVVAFYLMDLQEWEDAMKYAAAAIRINETYSPALRCIALITWQHGNTRKVSLRYFSAALEFGATNPYVLRTCAVIKAMEGHREEAIELMEASVAICPSCPLALRALAMMVYLYRNDASAALEHLERALSLSSGEDIECLRIKGQILMDQGRFKEARAALQQALYIVPWDAVSLASLGFCVSKLASKEDRIAAESSTFGVNYHSRLMSLQSFEDLIHSRDPEELMEAAVTMDLQRIFAGQANLSATGSEQYAKSKAKRAVNPFGQSNGMVLSNFAVENELEEMDSDFGNNMSGYAYYWYGMYEMKKVKHFNIGKTRTLFSLASKVAAPGASSSCNALAMYRLGEVAEREGHLEQAERHYQHAVQCEPMEPLSVLRLVGAVEQGLAGIKKLIRLLDAPRKRKGGKKAHKKKRSNVDSSGTLSTYHPPPTRNVHDSSLINNLTELLSKPLLVAPEDEDDGDLGHDTQLGDGATDADPLEEYQRRLLMHQRIHEMATLKRRSYRKSLPEGATASAAHHVFVDSYWLERLLHSFSTCEDWARLLKCTTVVQRVKPAAKKHK